MSDKTMRLDIVSAEEELFSAEVQMIYAPAEMGEVGITPKHTPLLTKLKAGDVRAEISDSETKIFFISGGILEIQPNAVTILSDTAERADSLDESEALKAKEAAEQSLADQQSTIDYTKAAAQLAEAVARLKTIQKLRKNI